MRTQKDQSTAWIIWFCATLFYAYEFYIRVTPTVMVPELIRDFHLSHARLGILSAAYYYAYASMQIPVGLLFDRFGIRTLLISAAMVVSLSCLMMSETNNIWVATTARIFMGVGSAFSFIACIKLARNWFSAKFLTIIIGLTNTLGIVGALISSTPLAYLLTIMSWRDCLLASAVMGSFIVILLMLFVQDYPSESREETINNNIMSSVYEIIRHPRTIITAIYGGLLVAPIAAFTELFAVQFLVDTHHLARVSAANLASFTYIGIGFGGPFFGALAAWVGHRRKIMFFSTVLASLSLASVIYIPGLSYYTLLILLFYFGFFTSHMLLIFAINSERHPAWASGTVIGVTNMLVMMGGTLFQPLLGYLFDVAASDKGQQVAHSVLYYEHVFSVLVVCQILAIGLLPFISEETK